jgi:hypothetical protein
MKCSECGKDFGVPGPACPHCGAVRRAPTARPAPYRTGRRARLAVGASVLFATAVIIGLGSFGRKAAVQDTRPAPAATPIDRAAQLMPPAERGFIAAILRGRAAYEASATEAEKAAARPARGRDICRAVPDRHVFAWTGTVDALSAKSDGKTLVSIELAPDIRLTTWNDEAAGWAPAVPDPALSLSLRALHPHQAVAFSGTFLPSPAAAADCYGESSTTLGGSMTRPAFLFALFGVAPIPVRDPAAAPASAGNDNPAAPPAR